MAERRLTVEDIKQICLDEVKKFTEGMSEDSIRMEVRSMLDKHKRSTILAALGLRDDWGRIEVDVRNGKNSLIENIFEAMAIDSAKTWLQEQLQSLPKLSAKDKQQLRSEATRVAYDKIRSHLIRSIEKNAASWVEGMDDAIGPLINAEFWERLRSAKND